MYDEQRRWDREERGRVRMEMRGHMQAYSLVATKKAAAF